MIRHRRFERVLRTLVVGLSSAAFGLALAADPPPADLGGGISSSAVAEIQAIVAEKAQRTPEEAKLDSNLLYAARATAQARLGQRSMQQQPAYVQSFVAAHVAADNTVKVTIKAKISDALLADLAAAGATDVNAVAQYDTVTARLPLEALLSIAQRPDVRLIDVYDPGTTQRYMPSADEIAALAQLGVGLNVSPVNVVAHGADKVQATGIDGTGVKVCVLSDGVNSLAAEVGLGHLPAGIDIVAGQAGDGDEGTAMLEIVHQIAPGAALGFATGFNGDAQMALNIQTLRNAPHNCHIIVDDVTYFLEPPFQEGVIAQAVTTVTGSGALFYSSAANSGNLAKGTSGTWQGDFVNGGSAGAPISAIETGTLHAFAGGTNYDTLTSQGSAKWEVLNWSDPMGASANDYDFFALDSTGTAVLAQSTNLQSGTQNPQEKFSVTTLPASSRLVILNFQGAAATRALRVDTQRGRLSIGTNGNTYGHNGGVNSVTLGAVPTSSAAGGPFTTASPIETYSSDGPRKLFYSPAGAALTPGNVLFGTNGGTTLAKVDIAAADCAPNFVTGFNPFCGTSAAAPHAAAIAALVKAAKPTLTSAQIKTAMASTALDIESVGVDVIAGSGLVMADAAVRSVLTPLAIGTNFVPTQVAPNVSSTLTITIGNSNSVALHGVAFTDNYPANLKNAAAPGTSITGAGCTGTLAAVASGTSFALTAGVVPAGVTCSYKVSVTSANIGMYVNSTGIVSTPVALNTSGVGATLTVSTVPTLAKKSDFNGDGKSDILFQNGSSRWFDYMNGVAVTSSVAVPGVAPGWVYAGMGDFNGDGRTDLLWRNSGAPNQYWIYLMNGNSVIGSGGLTVAAGYSATFIADFNGDGKADILFDNGAGGRWVYRMNGVAVASAVALPGAAPGWNLVSVGDYNGDGQADVLWQNSGSPEQFWIYLLVSNAIGGSGGFNAGAGYSLTKSGDFNGDGKTDLIFANGLGGRLFYFMNGVGVGSSAPVPPVAAGWTIVGTADFNGDGKTDILFRNGASPTQHWIFLQNGASTIGSAGFNVAPGYLSLMAAY